MKDQLGMTCSGLCMVHCLAMPALLAIGGLGAIGEFMASRAFHVALLLPVVLLAAISLPSAYLGHRRPLPLVLGVLGLAVLVSAQLAPHWWERPGTVAGGLLVVAAHLANHRYCRQHAIAQGPAEQPAVRC